MEAYFQNDTSRSDARTCNLNHLKRLRRATVAQEEVGRKCTRKTSVAAKFGSEGQRWLEDNIRTLSLCDCESYNPSNEADDL